MGTTVLHQRSLGNAPPLPISDNQWVPLPAPGSAPDIALYWSEFTMDPINLRVGNKLIGQSLIAALAPLFGRYHKARKSLRGSISRQSRQGLDWMNFFLADVQTAFGAFVAFYLADLGWSKGQVGLALTVGTLAGVISQIPGGALVDALRWKRGLAAIGIGMLCASALILALMPSFALVFLAEILHGLTAGIVTPAIAAISLGLVGRRAMSLRTGRNYRFNAAGNALTAGLMGLAGQYFAKSAILLGAARCASRRSSP
jgi:hypothetical protein